MGLYIRKFGVFSAITSLIVAMAWPQATLAQVGGDLNVSPKRIVFAPNLRNGTVIVFNQGASAVTYDVTVVDRAMLPDGEIIEQAAAAARVNTPDADIAKRVKSAADMMVYTPHRVTLAPGQSQTIRVRVSRPDDLAAGEYRTHLTITAVPPENAGLTAEQAASGAPGQLAVKVTALFSLSIPLIVRQGDADVSAGMDNIHVEHGGGADNNGQTLALDLVRKGKSSVYGDVEVRSAKGGAQPVGVIRGVAVYPEIDHRAVRVILTRPVASGDKLTVVFKDDDTQPGRVLATETITAP
jgi:P pilus assembly chaperone PapD